MSDEVDMQYEGHPRSHRDIGQFYLPPGTSLTFLWNPTPASSLLITQDHYSSPPASLPSTYSYLRTIPKPSCLPTLCPAIISLLL
ncbi:hypothetical protein UPYG_G00157650 [Umbra pygmaea]|uniref:Uncharacterized protein n=1 Tax=Umbra pygmaea TaxID=75934 RepID=A0ABD0XEN5_UMBPY